MPDRVTTRPRGVIPGCLPATDSFQELDVAAYKRSIERFCKEITDYIKEMAAIRKGL